MREYLFRGKTKETHEWVYGGYTVIENRHFIIKEITYSCGANSYGAFEVEPKTVGQYVEFNDRDGVRVFEDDVIMFCDEPLIVFWDYEAYQWAAKKPNAQYPMFRFPDANWDCIDMGWIAAEADHNSRITTQVSHNIHDVPVVYEDDDEDEAWEDEF